MKFSTEKATLFFLSYKAVLEKLIEFEHFTILEIQAAVGPPPDALCETFFGQKVKSNSSTLLIFWT